LPQATGFAIPEIGGDLAAPRPQQFVRLQRSEIPSSLTRRRNLIAGVQVFSLPCDRY
jgi:hypothetical protein